MGLPTTEQCATWPAAAALRLRPTLSTPRPAPATDPSDDELAQAIEARLALTHINGDTGSAGSRWVVLLAASPTLSGVSILA
ncbi:hypothetical protein [Actinoallomurus bryophytorum]|uniref:hypothetical protein n=1 Tax=Actinoallomurus bryophytorum TaxID=1490222 RepID=UPI001153F15E|nr:hypothetical protein [Actinoallomurus bryophytorum]